MYYGMKRKESLILNLIQMQIGHETLMTQKVQLDVLFILETYKCHGQARSEIVFHKRLLKHNM